MRAVSIPVCLSLLAGAHAQEGNAVLVPEGATREQIVALAAGVTPSPRQLAWQRIEFQAFVHFGMNTFTDREWGDGKEDPTLFNPSAFDANQWVASFQAAGMRGVILTAKHHDGFCLWPTRTTEHCVRNSPWMDGKGDVVGAVAAACREAGLAFGIYLSPWDRNSEHFGKPRYNEIFREQLRELLSGYGPLHEVWMDGAHAPRGKPELFDWSGHWALVRELQPGAVISVCGPDVRWCGNEAGHVRASEWSVVPLECGDLAPATHSQAKAEALVAFDCTPGDLGSREALRGARQLAWRPAQTNTSIRPGWFYHPAQDDQQRSLENLLDIYYGSVGGNSQFLLNVPPDRTGRIHANDVRRLSELGDVLRASFREDLAPVREEIPEGEMEGWTYDLGARRCFDLALLSERIEQGQRVEEFALDVWKGGQWVLIASGTTIGSKRLVRFPEQCARRLRLRVPRARRAPVLGTLGLFLAPAVARTEYIAQGEYILEKPPRGVQVIALGDGEYRALEFPGGLPGAGWDGAPPRTIGMEGMESWPALHRQSPTLGAPPPDGAVVLLGPGVNDFVDGKGNPKSLDEEGFLTEGAFSRKRFGDCRLHIEFRLPFKPRARGQGRGNSGIYMEGRYEVQILDSFGLSGEHNECGGIYSIARPAVNMCFPPMSWQSYDIDFTAARWNAAGERTAPARMSVRHNGVWIHRDVELPHATTAAPRKLGPEPGPVFLQNHGNPVRYRNIWFVSR